MDQQSQTVTDTSGATSNQTGPNVSPDIRDFLLGLIEDSGMADLDEATKNELVQGLYARFDNFMASVILENLSPEDAEAFIRMNEQASPKEEIEQYLRDKMPNSEEVLAKALVDFRDFYLGNQPTDQSAPVNQ